MTGGTDGNDADTGMPAASSGPGLNTNNFFRVLEFPLKRKSGREIIGIHTEVRWHLYIKTVPRHLNRTIGLKSYKFSTLHKNHTFQYMGRLIFVQFQISKVPLKSHTKYPTHILKYVWRIEKIRILAWCAVHCEIGGTQGLRESVGERDA